MTRKRLARLVQTPELDYVQHFQELAKVNIALDEQGPQPDLLVTKAILELDMGRFQAARQAARDALRLAPDLAEAHYVKGFSSVLSAFVRAGVFPGGPGARESFHDTVRELFREAATAFGAAVRLNPGDEESREALAVVSWALATCSDEETLTEMLRRPVD